MTINPFFETVWEKDILEISTHAILLLHKKTGAQVIALQNKDTNKAFGISFKTLPSDSMGIPHILEHSVLAGSTKYPLKEPFIELIKSSLKTFVNAYTFPDKTIYPVASENQQDLLNMMDVYLDGVFNPLLSENILKQEGWRYELDNITDDPIYNGIVFSEMKGAMSNSISLLEDAIIEGLYPQTIYKYNSGGDPKDIPRLKFQEFKNFHIKYYHPSNSKSLIYGNMDLDKALVKLHEYFDEFEQEDINTEITLQANFDKNTIIEKYYPIGENELKDNKYIVTSNWSLNPQMSSKEKIGLEILNYMLNYSEASPIKKELVDEGHAEELSPITFEMEVQQPYIAIGAMGVKKDSVDIITSKIDEVLLKMSNGIDLSLLESSINRVDFDKREGEFASEPKNIAYLRLVLENWNYNRDPIFSLTFRKEIDEIKEGIKNHDFYLESLIIKNFLNNNNHSTAKLVPDPLLSLKLIDDEKKELKAYKVTLSSAQLEQLVVDTKKLKEWQSRKDSDVDLAKIPRLKVTDLSPMTTVIPFEKDDKLIVPTITHNIDTNEIIYFDIGFDLLNIPVDYSYTRLISKCLLKFGSEKMPSNLLSLNLEKYLGGINIHTFISNEYAGSGNIVAKFIISTKLIEENISHLFDLLDEIIFKANMNDKSRFMQILKEEKSQFESAILSISASQIAGTRASSFIDGSYAIKDKLGGIEYYNFLKNVEKEVEEDWEKVHRDLNAFKSYLHRSLSFYNITCNDQLSQKIKNQLESYSTFFTKSPQNPVSFKRHSSTNEGYTIPSSVNYCAQAFDLYKEYEVHGSIFVVNLLLQTDYLWSKLRVQNGAYGGRSGLDLTSGIYSFRSWRDPQISKTFDVFDETFKYLIDNNLSQSDIEGAIIGTIGSLDSYMTPIEKGYVSLTRYLSHVSYELLNKIRTEVLNTSSSNIIEFGNVLQKVSIDSKTLTVIGNKEKIEAEKGIFDKIIELK